MKILHLISQHPESTGSGYYLQNILKHCYRAGHRNYLICGVSGAMEPRLEGVESNNCRCIRFGTGNLPFAIPGMSDIMPYPSSRYSDLSPEQLANYKREFSRAITACHHSFNPDLIHSHHLWLATSIARCTMHHIPQVTSCHSTDLRQFSNLVHLRNEVVQPCRQLDRILALSRPQAEQITELYGIDSKRIDIVGGGFDDHLFSLTTKPAVGPVHLLYAGKLSFAKGVDWLLRTFLHLADDSVHLHLAGSGSGEEMDHCLHLAGQRHDHITVHGRLSQRQLAALMGRCHIFILPSFFEGLPLVVLEAIASGCRIITTDLPGCRELLGEEDHDLIRYIPLPPLEEIDRPAGAQFAHLERALGTAIESAVTQAQRQPDPAPGKIREKINKYSWDAVFARISDAYSAARAGFPASSGVSR